MIRSGKLVEQEVEAARRDLADRWLTARTHPDRWPRPLHGGRLNDDVLEIPEFAVMGEAPFGSPRLEDNLQAFLEPLVGLLARDAEGEFAVAISLANSEIEPTAREHVEGRGLLCEQHRIVPGQNHDGRAEAQGLGACCEVGQEAQRCRDRRPAG
jgi:hypothetical protein